MATTAKVEAALEEIEHMRQALGEDEYYKCLVTIAYEFVYAKEGNRGLQVLMRCPVEYLRVKLLEQTREDKAFADAVCRLAYYIIKMEDAPVRALTPKDLMEYGWVQAQPQGVN